MTAQNQSKAFRVVIGRIIYFPRKKQTALELGEEETNGTLE
jgi:hypothetical protein